VKIEARGARTSPIQAERSAVVKRKPRPALGTDRGSDMGIFEGAGSLPSSPIQAECSAGVNGPPASHNLNRKPLWTGRLRNCLLADETAPRLGFFLTARTLRKAPANSRLRDRGLTDLFSVILARKCLMHCVQIVESSPFRPLVRVVSGVVNKSR
jgi:hypothetical protein